MGEGVDGYNGTVLALASAGHVVIERARSNWWMRPAVLDFPFWVQIWGGMGIMGEEKFGDGKRSRGAERGQDIEMRGKGESWGFGD